MAKKVPDFGKLKALNDTKLMLTDCGVTHAYLGPIQETEMVIMFHKTCYIYNFLITLEKE